MLQDALAAAAAARCYGRWHGAMANGRPSGADAYCPPAAGSMELAADKTGPAINRLA